MISQICKYVGATGVLNCENELESVQNLESQFVEHITTQGLNFATAEEYKFRMNLFMETDAELKKINSEENNTFIVDHNVFSTMTASEKNRMMGRNFVNATEEREFETYELELEANVDWRQKGAVNRVQNQGQCGSCWAFSTTAAVEGAHQIKTGTLLKLSESQLVDCDRGDGGCEGGLEWNAMKYLKTNPQELESAYPYRARKQTCKFSKAKGQVSVTAINYVQSKSASALKSSIAQGPTCVGINASSSYFQNYRSGILNTSNCSPQQDHAITAVGYGSNFFIVRNSWGGSWGESGYIRISSEVGGSGVCGILIDASRPGTN
jgi:C1A family cysteine protease